MFSNRLDREDMLTENPINKRRLAQDGAVIEIHNKYRTLQVEIDTLKPGIVQKREPAKPQRQTYYARRYGQQAFGPGSRLIGSLQVSYLAPQ